MMPPSDLEELYLTTIRAPVVVIFFLGLWGVVLMVMQYLRIDYPAVLTLPKVADRPRAAFWQVQLVSGGLFTLLFGCLYASDTFRGTPNVAMGVFYLAVGVLLALPLHGCIRDNSLFFAGTLGLVFSPTTDVHFTEVFVADALTSLSKVFSDVGVAVVLLLSAWMGGGVYPYPLKVAVSASLASLPYWLRVRQCSVQYKYEVEYRRKRLHAINIGKYLSAFPMIWLGALQALQNSPENQAQLAKFVVGAAVINSLYSLAWDIKMDWGLAQPGAKLLGLRNTTLVGGHCGWPYYLAILVDAALRMAWAAKFYSVQFGFRDMVLTLELLEVTRRSMWNIFRVEWECIQTAGEGTNGKGLEKQSLLRMEKVDLAQQV